MKKLILTLITALFLTSMIAEPAQAMIFLPGPSHTPITTTSGRALSMREVETAIINGGAQRGWRFQKISPGRMIGKLNVRGKHHVEVDIKYSTKTYSISYRSSRNMKYNAKKKTIHVRYGRWVRNLDNEILVYMLSK